MNIHKATKRYSKAFFDLSLSQNSLELVYSDLVSLKKLIKETPEFIAFLSDPVIPLKKQLEVLNDLFDGKCSKLTFRFLTFLAEKRKLYLLDQIIDGFEKLFFIHKNILTVDIISASKLENYQVENICQKLQKNFNKQINYHLDVDPAIVGGFKIVINDTILDYSVKTQLNRFYETVLKS